MDRPASACSGQGAGLVEQSTSTPASSSIRDNLVTIACFFASRRAPTAMVTDSTVGHGYRDCSHQQYQCEFQRAQDRIMTEEKQWQQSPPPEPLQERIR